MADRAMPDPFVAAVGRRLGELLQTAPATRLCVALSGGPDSVALLAALAASGPSLPLRALHVHHHLQPQADGWMRGCRRLGRALGVPVAVQHVTVAAGRGRSLEAAAREARRDAFLGALRPGEALLTAHHLDDQLETILLMLLRGSGVHGLAAMPAVQRFGQGWLLRPLLEQPRSAVAAFVARRGLPQVSDPSNADERFDRNFLRRRITPLLEQRWPGAARTAARSARLLGEARGLLDDLAHADLAALASATGAATEAMSARSLSLAALARLSPARQRNALRAWLRDQGAVLPDEVHLERIRLELPRARPDAQPAVRWSGGEVRRFRGRLYLLPGSAASEGSGVAKGPPPTGAEWRWSRGRPFPLGAGRGALRLVADPTGPIARRALPAVLQVRMRPPGGRVALRADGPRRAVKELLREAAVLPWERARLPIVCDGAQIVAVATLFVAAPYRAAQRARGGRLRLEWLQAPVLCAPEDR